MISPIAGTPRRSILSFGRLTAGFLLAGLVAATSALPPAQAPVAQAAPDPIYWGAYVDGAPFDTTKLDRFEADAGKKQSIVHWGEPWQMNGGMMPFQTAQYEAVRLRGSIPMITWSSMNTSAGVDDPNFALAKISNGSFDTYITTWAKAAKTWGHPFFIRFDHEMNGSWFTWSEGRNGNQPGDYVKAWRHVVDIFRSVGATNATWVWCANVTSNSEIPLANVYPGDTYVDWTSIDGYNWGTDHGMAWFTFDQVYGMNPWTKHNSYNDLVAVAPSKPIMIGETATSKDGGDPAAWIKDALSTQLPNYTQIRALVWFNWNAGETALDWPIESSTAQQTAFQQNIASSYYATNTFGSLPFGPIAPFGVFTPADITSPSMPTGATATSTSASQIALSWTASTDNVGVTGYNIFRDAATTPLNTTLLTGTTYADSGLASASRHNYSIQAQDAAANLSTLSSLASATTFDSVAPTQPTGVTATGASASDISLSWTRSTDNVGVAGYNIFRDGATTPLNTSLVTGTTYTDTGLAPAAPHNYTVQAQDAAGNVSTLSSPATATTQPPVAASPVILLSAPVRLADTRSTAPIGPVAAGASRCFTVAGQAGIPLDAMGVVVNLTAVAPTGQGWLTLFPNAAPLSVPSTSTLNFGPSQFAVANSAMVRIGTGGAVCVNAGGTGTNLQLDAVGYVPTGSATLMQMLARPARMMDTRASGGMIQPSAPRCFNMAGQGGIPTTATGVLLNITAVGYAGSGWLTGYPAGLGVPATSTLNFDSRASAIANNTFMKLGTNGQLCIAAGQSASQVILDAVGYLTADGLAKMPLLPTPQRVIDTRSSGGTVVAGTSRCFTIAGVNGIPADATGVLANVTATNHPADGTLSLYANGATPTTATVNFDFSSESAIANGTFVRLGTGGQVCISAAQSSAQAIVDVTGYME